jgi:hypothetical protein
MKIRDIINKALHEDDAETVLDNDPAVKAAQANVDKATQMLAMAQQSLATARANASKKLTQAKAVGGQTNAPTANSATPLSGA